MKKVILAFSIMLITVGCNKIELKEIAIIHGNISYNIETTENLLVDILAENNIHITADDIISVNNKEVQYNQLDLLEVKNNAKVKIVIVTIVETSESKEIKFSTERVEDNSIDIGTEKVSINGKNGLETTVNKKIYHNGVFFEEVEEVTSIDPITKVILVGSKESSSSPRVGDTNGSNGSNSTGGNSGSGNNNGGSSNDNDGGANTKPPSNCTITINGIVHPCNE